MAPRPAPPPAAAAIPPGPARGAPRSGPALLLLAALLAPALLSALAGLGIPGVPGIPGDAAPDPVPGAAATPAQFPRRLGWYVPGGAAAALAQLRDQGLAGELRAADGAAAGEHVAARWDPRGLADWTVSGHVLAGRVALDLPGAGCSPRCYSTLAGPAAPLGQPEQGVMLVDAPRAALVAAAPGGVEVRLDPAATRVRAAGDRAAFAHPGGLVLVAGEGLVLDGAAARAPALLVARLDPAEAEAALALPPALLAWTSPGPAGSTLWLSPGLRVDEAPGEPPRLRFAPRGEGRAAARVEVGRLADPDLGPVVLDPLGQAVPEIPAAALAGSTGVAYNVTRTRPPAVWIAHDAAQGLDVAFRLDLQPPRVTAWETVELRDTRALLRATADEHVLGRLEYHPAGDPPGAAPLLAVTTRPALRLDFPLLSLRPDTAYEYRLGLTDFAGNTAWDGPRTFTTAPRPDVPAPRVLRVEPAEGAHLAAAPAVLRVAFDPAGTFDPGQHLRLAVDKREVVRGLVHAVGEVSYAPDPPLGPGMHTVGVFLRNAEGGSAEKEWRFTVAPAAAPVPGPGGAAVAWAGLLAAQALRRAGGRRARRPGDP